MRRSGRAAIAAIVTGVLVLMGCGQGRGDAEPEATAPLEGTTPSKYEMLYTAAVEGKGTWEVKLTVFPPATLDEATGKMNTVIAGGDGTRLDKSEVDPLACHYADALDMVVPVALQARRTDADEPSTVSMPFQVQWFYGFGPVQRSLAAYVNHVGYLSSECDMWTVGDKDRSAVGAVTGFGGPAGSWSGGVSYFYLNGPKCLSPEKQAELLGSLSVKVDPTAFFDSGDRVKVTYETPDTVRLLKGNGCLAVFEPLDLAFQSEQYTTFAEQNCDPVVWHQE